MLLQEAQMQIANDTMGDPIAFSTPESVPESFTANLNTRLESWMPNL